MALEEDSLLESLRWVVEFLDICPEEVLPFTPKILAHMLPAMASGVESIRDAAARGLWASRRNSDAATLDDMLAAA